MARSSTPSLRSNGTGERYSDREIRVFAQLPKDGSPIESSEIAKKYYNGKLPPHGQASIIGALSALTAKVIRNKEPFRIMKSKRSGPWPIKFWIEKEPGH